MERREEGVSCDRSSPCAHYLIARCCHSYLSRVSSSLSFVSAARCCSARPLFLTPPAPSVSQQAQTREWRQVWVSMRCCSHSSAPALASSLSFLLCLCFSPAESALESFSFTRPFSSLLIMAAPAASFANDVSSSSSSSSSAPAAASSSSSSSSTLPLSPAELMATVISGQHHHGGPPSEGDKEGRTNIELQCKWKTNSYDLVVPHAATVGFLKMELSLLTNVLVSHGEEEGAADTG